MKDRKLASRYARALLSVVRDPGTRERTDRFLTSLAEAMRESAELRVAMLDPAVPRPARQRILRSLVGPLQLPAQVGNFLDTLVENNRIAALDAIAAVFHELREEAAGIVPARLSTAVPLDESQKQRARSALERLTGREVRLSCTVEPALLGGAVARIGSTVYDGSLRSQLNQLKRRMSR